MEVDRLGTYTCWGDNNRTMSLKTWLMHKKIVLFGDRELEENGKVIPCSECNTMFKSYCHFGDLGYTYDSICPGCRQVRRMLDEQEN